MLLEQLGFSYKEIPTKMRHKYYYEYDMKQEERASIVRIVSDLIKADGIIDTREIDFLDAIRNKYSITKEDEICAADYTLSKALKYIVAADDATKHAFISVQSTFPFA